MSLDRRSFLISATVSAGALACPPLIARAQSQVEITVSHGVPNFPGLLDALTNAFREKHPDIRVNFVAGGDNWAPLLQTTLRDSVADNLPDATWQNLTFVNILASREIVVPLNDLFGGVATLEAMGISAPMIGSTTINGQTYGIPYGTTIPVVFCNMDLLHQAGYAKDTPPETWQEIFDVGAKIAKLGAGINGGFIEYNSTNAWIFQNLLTSFGGRMTNGNEIAFDGAEGLRSMETLARFGDINNVPMSKSQARQAFDSGATGFQVRSASGTTSVSKAAVGHFDVQVSAFPLSAPNGRLAGASHGLFLFSKEPEKQKAVWELMRFISSPEGQLILAQNTGYMPINLVALKDRQFQEQYLKINPLHKALIDRLAVTEDQYSFPSDNTVKIFDMMIDECRQVVEHTKLPSAGLADMAEKTRKLL